MSKKIVVVTGSPRRNGNSFAMTDAFIKAAEEKGHTKKFIRSQRLCYDMETLRANFYKE